MSNNKIIKTLMVTGTSEDPRKNDNWSAAYDLELDKDYSLQDLVAIASFQPWQRALWVYHGPEFENKLTGEQYLHPWDHLEYLTLVRPACRLADNDDDHMLEWRKEIANEEGMLQGINAYNECMGY